MHSWITASYSRKVFSISRGADLSAMNGGEDTGRPLVMGIVNMTPDSFHATSRHASVDAALRTAEHMVAEGAQMLDVGGLSTRPGSLPVDPTTELARVVPVIEALANAFPGVAISVDTYRASVATAAVQAGASWVNDISAGDLDPGMLAAVAASGAGYMAMHMQGTPATMQQAPTYNDVVGEVYAHLADRITQASDAGITAVVVDPGIGFGKTTTHNFALLHAIPRLKSLGKPVLIGLSRKRLINEVLGTTPAEALNGSTVLHTIALLGGADILRVHDVRAAVEAVALVEAYRGSILRP